MSNAIDVDVFAGAGGTSTGIRQATGKPVDFAINHDAYALAAHHANHPETTHLHSSVHAVDPREIAARGRIRIAAFAPDCTHHSRAKGGPPDRSLPARRSRDLAWTAVRWAEQAHPRLIILENVPEFVTWGPLLANGKRCKHRAGQTFRRWLAALQSAGYAVEYRVLRACDYGTPTSRSRLLVVARNDQMPIRWPAPTHGIAPDLLPYRTAAHCIDWSLPTPSIFLDPDRARAAGCRRPLAASTLQRIATGLFRHTLHHANPFIVPLTHAGPRPPHSLHEPLRTVTCAQRGELALAVPGLVPANPAALAAAWMVQHNRGMIGRSLDDPLYTIVCTGPKQALSLATLRPAADPPGSHRHEVLKLIRRHAALRCPSCPGSKAGCPCRQALLRFNGTDWHVTDIGIRLLSPRELFLAQGFPPDYIIDLQHKGSPLSKTRQVRMCGNAVPPALIRAIVSANLRLTGPHGPHPADPSPFSFAMQSPLHAPVRHNPSGN